MKLKVFSNAKKVNWKLKNGKGIISLGKKGKITALKKGKAKIIACSNNKKKLITVKCKNTYYNNSFSQVSKIMVRNLTYGTECYLEGNDIDVVSNILNSGKLYKVVNKDSEKKVGNGKYSLYLYNDNGVEIETIFMENDGIKVCSNDNVNGKVDTYYTSDESIDYTSLDNLLMNR